MARPSTLASPATDLVLNALRTHQQPLTAYALLALLKPHGINSAPIIYRALEQLAAQASVHRLQMLNAYVACDCHADHTHGLSILTVCTGCSHVHELHDHAVIHHLEGLRTHGVALAHHAVIELPVQCTSCAA